MAVENDPTAQQASDPVYRVKYAEPTNPSWQMGWEIEYTGPDPEKALAWVEEAHRRLLSIYPRTTVVSKK